VTNMENLDSRVRGNDERKIQIPVDNLEFNLVSSAISLAGAAPSVAAG
jgi:hypothetical protein